jgi:hypothetical protein
MLLLVRMHAAATSGAVGAVANLRAFSVHGELSSTDEASESLFALSGSAIPVERLGLAGRAHDIRLLPHRGRIPRLAILGNTCCDCVLGASMRTIHDPLSAEVRRTIVCLLRLRLSEPLNDSHLPDRLLQDCEAEVTLAGFLNFQGRSPHESHPSTADSGGFRARRAIMAPLKDC